MDWKAYTLHMLATNLIMAVIIFLILVFQDLLPLNPRHFAGMEPMLAFNTAMSFITNTDWQAYGGETTLSNFSQMAAITFPMFTSATTGFVVAMAFIRAFTIKRPRRRSWQFLSRLDPLHDTRPDPRRVRAGAGADPAGRAADARADVVAHTIGGGEQTIALGPVASLETIKHLGTNGGGFFNANAAHPVRKSDADHQPHPSAADDRSAEFDRDLLRRDDRQSRRQGWVLYGVMGAMLIMFLPFVVVPEQAGTPLLAKAGIETAASADSARRQHGGQGSALRHRRERIVRRRHHAASRPAA